MYFCIGTNNLLPSVLSIPELEGSSRKSPSGLGPTLRGEQILPVSCKFTRLCFCLRGDLMGFQKEKHSVASHLQL